MNRPAWVVRLGWRLIGEEERAATHLRYITAVCAELAAHRRAVALADPMVADALAMLTPDVAAAERSRLGLPEPPTDDLPITKGDIRDD